MKHLDALREHCVECPQCMLEMWHFGTFAVMHAIDGESRHTAVLGMCSVGDRITTDAAIEYAIASNMNPALIEDARRDLAQRIAARDGAAPTPADTAEKAN